MLYYLHGIFGLGIILPTPRFTREMLFFGDQGQDLLVALRIVRGEFFPAVGPYLSVTNFFIPPTYYYFLALLLYIFKSEAVVIYVYTVLNIVSGVFFALYLKHKTDTITATIFFSLYMFASHSIEQARFLWQPFPVAFFVSAALLVLIGAEKKYSYGKLFLSILLFTFGLTIYPSAILLVPMFIFEWFSVFEYKSRDTIIAWCSSIFSFGMVLAIVSTSWIIHEFANNFPTFHAVFNSSHNNFSRFIFYDNVQGFIQRILLHLVAMYRLIIPDINNPLTYYQRIFDISFLILLGFIILILLKTALYKKFNSFLFSLRFPYLLLGIFPLVFFNTLKNSQHHLIVLLPFLLFIFSYIVRLILISPKIPFKLLGIILVVIFYLTNFIFDWPCPTCLQSYNNVFKLYSFLMSDVRSRDQPLNSYDIKFVTLPNDFNFYEVQPLWYLLKKYHNYPVTFNKDGNDSIRSGTILKNTQFTYLICYPPSLNGKKCWDAYLPYNSQTIIVKYEESGPYSIYLVKNDVFKQ